MDFYSIGQAEQAGFTGFIGLFVFQFPACLAIASAKLRRLDETK